MSFVVRDRIVINDLEHGRAVARRAGAIFNPDGDQVIARVRDDELLGGMVYTAHVPGTSIAIHTAGFVRDWANRDLIWASFHYPFVQLSVKRVFGQVQASNARALEVNRKLGFKEVARIPGVFSCGDLVVVSMHRDECRWIHIRPRGLISNRSEVEHDGWQEQGAPAP
ncbi:hypothetical protein [Methylobacterium sp. 285MFTsu5.1]|uniref:hypothetical protein n=1 Tax=Methylobacterium sp. 285MFTsu5.1 TaxID=1172187 RepID=UPI00036942DA|nr:hypothetical protein [Methylobacterium sp. 285MFTsu5.1]